MPLSPDARDWLNRFGTGPINYVLNTATNMSDLTERLQRTYPDLTLEAADELIAYGLQSREAARLAVSGELTPEIFVASETGSPISGRQRYRYRFRFTFIDPATGATRYRTVVHDADDLVTGEDLSMMADAIGEEFAEEGTSDTQGTNYVSFRLDSVTAI